MSDIDKAFGSAVKTRRLQLGLSQEALAFQAGLHRTYISDLERGRKGPSLRVVLRIAFALDMTAPDLVQMTENHALSKSTLEEHNNTD